LKFTNEEAINLIREMTAPTVAEKPAPSSTPQYPNGLTEREVEVLRLVAAGLSNPEIAEKMIISRRTVEAHLRSIFAKTEVTSSAAATRFALENNLT